MARGRVVVRTTARGELRDLAVYLGEQRPASGLQLVEDFARLVSLLEEQPRLAPAWEPLPGFRIVHGARLLDRVVEELGEANEE